MSKFTVGKSGEGGITFSLDIPKLFINFFEDTSKVKLAHVVILFFVEGAPWNQIEVVSM